MTKKILCLLLSVVLTATVGGSFVFAEEVGLPSHENQAVLEETPQLEKLESEDAVRELEEIRENITDRFIVKFRDNTNASLETVTESAYASAKDAKNQAVSTVLEAKGISLENVYREESKSNIDDRRLKDVLSDIDTGEPALFALDQNASSIQSTEFTALQEDKRVISLPEKVDPNVFVEKVQESLGEEIEYIQPDYKLELAANEDESLAPETMIPDPALPEQEIGEQLEGAAENTKANGTGTIVAVIDTGIDTTHPDLAAHVVDGYDFCNERPNVYDPALGMEQAHGTHVAGIIAQTAPEAKILPLKCFENGRAYTSDLIEAIDFAKENGASIVNCSWGGKDNNQALREAMEGSGLFFVCAAGNNRIDMDETPIYPASFGLDNSISVTSLNQDYGFSYYSNYGMSIDIAAIGRDVESFFPGGARGKMNGSSMSAGFVSGAAAIAKATGETDLKARIISTGDKLSNLQNKLKDGRVLNLDRLVSNTQSDEILPCTPADDFDIHGYQPTPEENWELFSQSRAIQVDGGDGYSLVLKENGTVWACGENSHGILGDGTAVDRLTPIQVVGLQNIIKVAAGSRRALALRYDGTVFEWGSDYVGEGAVPQKVVGLTKVKSIASGTYHRLACTTDGFAFGWGSSKYGALEGANKSYSSPNQFSLTGVTEVAAGYEFSLFLKGTIPYDIGLYNRPKLETSGTGWVFKDYFQPFNNTFSEIYAHEDGRVAIEPERGVKIYSWGARTAGGIPVNDDYPVFDTHLSYTSRPSSVAIGDNFKLVLESAGTVFAKGMNKYGQLGEGSDKVTFSRIKDINDMVGVGAGSDHSLFIKSDGTVWGMGSNRYGQLGDGTTTSTSQPVQMGFNSSDPPKEFVRLLPDTDISGQIAYTDQVDEYVFSPIKSGNYTFSKSGQGSVDLYEDNNLILADIPTDTTLSFKYPNKYYFKVHGIGTYSIRLNSPEAGSTGHAFDTTIGSNTYYANFKDGGKLYMNTTKLTDTPAMWLCTDGSSLFYNSQGSLYKYSGSAMLLAPVNAYYIVSDGSYLYFSNWSDGGRLYRSDLMGTNLACICKDIGTWLSINGEYIYYYNSLDGGAQYKVLKTMTNAAQGEKVQ